MVMCATSMNLEHTMFQKSNQSQKVNKGIIH